MPMATHTLSWPCLLEHGTILQEFTSLDTELTIKVEFVSSALANGHAVVTTYLRCDMM